MAFSGGLGIFPRELAYEALPMAARARVDASLALTGLHRRARSAGSGSVLGTCAELGLCAERLPAAAPASGPCEESVAHESRASALMRTRRPSDPALPNFRWYGAETAIPGSNGTKPLKLENRVTLDEAPRILDGGRRWKLSDCTQESSMTASLRCLVRPEDHKGKFAQNIHRSAAFTTQLFIDCVRFREITEHNTRSRRKTSTSCSHPRRQRLLPDRVMRPDAVVLQQKNISVNWATATASKTQHLHPFERLWCQQDIK